MTRVTLCSAKGSPGVTTLACVLGAVWPPDRAVVVAECDPSGGDLAGRFGLSTRRGVTSLVLTDRQQVGLRPDYRDHAQQLPGGLDVLVGPTGADSAMALDHELGMSSSDLIHEDCDLVADCGRLLPGATGQGKVIRSSDGVVLLVRPDVSGIANARWATSRIRELSQSPVFAVIVGAGTFKSAEVSDELDVSVLGTIPFDPRAARMACGVPGTAKEFVRSGLVAFAREIVITLIETTSVGPGRGHGNGRRRNRDRGNRHRILQRLSAAPGSPRPRSIQPDERPRTVSP
jgi:MinD-like ATPase involved in chromosome partitioning or flagellar assembly